MINKPNQYQENIKKTSYHCIKTERRKRNYPKDTGFQLAQYPIESYYILRHEHVIATLCRVFRVNISSYYKHFSRNELKRDLENQRIRTCILRIYSESKCRYGTEKMRKVLEMNDGTFISPSECTG